ncbi:hypothetical protein J437_LFUL012724 [Ladona fulva]|uniref:Uncharacterized protein n=1 Tax=Ladona fulva TaxID=123851 RepID=A0A8K0PAQ8_LADFU|nr:hypothetical protein J437_LFUL012724 [Ladona fulva]
MTRWRRTMAKATWRDSWKTLFRRDPAYEEVVAVTIAVEIAATVRPAAATFGAPTAVARGWDSSRSGANRRCVFDGCRCNINRCLFGIR